MKIFSSVILLILLFYCYPLTAQQKNSSGCGSPEKIRRGTELKLKFYGASRTGGAGDTRWQNGYGISASLQFKTMDYLSVYFGLDIAQMKLVEKSETYPSYIVADKLTPASSLNIGVRAYPLKDEYPVYLKFGVDVMFRKSSVNKDATVVPPFTGELGIGYELWLSDRFNLYPEISHVFVNEASEVHFGAGISVRL